MRRLLNILDRGIFLLAFAVIGFVVGVVYAVNNTSLQVSLAAFKGVVANMMLDPYRHSWRHPAPANAGGVLRHDVNRAQPGLTFYTSGDLQGARLIDMGGKEVHRWTLSFADAFGEDAAHINYLVDPPLRHWETAHLFPNGDVLAVFIGEGSTPNGYGLVRIDKDSRLLWKAPFNAHHDISVGADGRIYTLGQRIRERPVKGWPNFTAPFLDDTLVVLSPGGGIEKEISIADAFARSDYAHYLELVRPNERGDVLHANQAEVLDGRAAARLPFARAGNVLISLRDIHVLAVLNPDAGRIVWAVRGPWLYQHDPDLLDSGDMLVFDNRGHAGPGGASRVVEFDPTDMAIVWQYAGSAEDPLYSRIRSNAQRLANGNTLVVESDAGRIVEVTPGGDIVWEFVNPARAREGALIAAIGLDAERIDRNWLTFLRDN
jgi:outer membrane protein assembly factor BamB